jgi:hypothetical protein
MACMLSRHAGHRLVKGWLRGLKLFTHFGQTACSLVSEHVMQLAAGASSQYMVGG